MSLATLTSADVARIHRLIERKEALAQQIAEINSELESIESGASESAPSAGPATRTAAAAKPTPATSAGMPRKKGKAGRMVRGELKEKITAQLKTAGSQGMKVKDLAARIGTSYGNVTAFFQSTGKKIKEIKKVGPAQFAWTGE